MESFKDWLNKGIIYEWIIDKLVERYEVRFIEFSIKNGLVLNNKKKI